jgi:hypothetical protein
MIKIWRHFSHLLRSYSTFCVFDFGSLVAKPRIWTEIWPVSYSYLGEFTDFLTVIEFARAHA